MEQKIPESPSKKLSALALETGLQSPKIIEPYTASLNQTDVNYGIKGHNKYYVLQVIESNVFYL